MQAILFDLDGTLLPMDMDAFIKGYFHLLTKKAAARGYAPDALTDGIWRGTAAMVQNDGGMFNCDRFWTALADRLGDRVHADRALFDEFYENEFQGAVRFTDPAPEAAQRAVRAAHERAERVILATNPVFPRAGVLTRLRWLGLSAEDFDHLTDYENAAYCKPNVKYYEEILAAYGLCAGDCLMVGNDMDEDILPAAALGMRTLLVRDCMINRSGAEPPDLSGSLDGLADALLTL